MIEFPKRFNDAINYHERRVNSSKASNAQKNFSDGFLTGALMIENGQGSESAPINARKALAAIKDPTMNPMIKEQAKGLIASLYDYSKEIPKDMNVWGVKKQKREKK